MEQWCFHYIDGAVDAPFINLTPGTLVPAVIRVRGLRGLSPTASVGVRSGSTRYLDRRSHLFRAEEEQASELGRSSRSGARSRACATRVAGRRRNTTWFGVHRTNGPDRRPEASAGPGWSRPSGSARQGGWSDLREEPDDSCQRLYPQAWRFEIAGPRAQRRRLQAGVVDHAGSARRCATMRSHRRDRSGHSTGGRRRGVRLRPFVGRRAARSEEHPAIRRSSIRRASRLLADGPNTGRRFEREAVATPRACRLRGQLGTHQRWRPNAEEPAGRDGGAGVGRSDCRVTPRENSPEAICRDRCGVHGYETDPRRLDRHQQRPSRLRARRQPVAGWWPRSRRAYIARHLRHRRARSPVGNWPATARTDQRPSELVSTPSRASQLMLARQLPGESRYMESSLK